MARACASSLSAPNQLTHIGRFAFRLLSPVCQAVKSDKQALTNMNTFSVKL